MDSYLASCSAWLNSLPVPIMEGDSPVLQFIGRWSYEVYKEREMFLMYLHLIFSCLFPIYTGSHASLHCPPSAADSAKKKSSTIGDSPSDGDYDELDDLEEGSSFDGLTPSDAILFPVFASLTLGGLYYLIKWLNDPALLNKILGYYFSLMGIFGVGKLAGDTLNVLVTFVFPSVWSRGTDIYYVDPILSIQVTNAPAIRSMNRGSQLHRKITDKHSPLPGALSSVNFPGKVNKMLWSFRALVTDHWILRCFIHGISNIKTKVRFNDVMGLSLGISAIVMYNNGKAWWLTNLMGFGFCYGTIQMMSPTTFWTGSLVLAGLFVYDIVMVFYTPMMVTVATSLDVPIKLVFPHSKRGGMLGLGDIVLPGIMIALALRFDLYLYYLRKPSPPAISHSLTPDANPKPLYVPATSRWGDRFWTRSLPKSALPPNVAAATFPKVYFYASIIGYVIGMIATLVVLNLFNHAQPALLYLVPCVLTAVWGTALLRGELKLMWNYNEASSTDDEKETEDEKEKVNDKGKEEKEKKEKEDRESKKLKTEHAVFLLSLSSPRRGPRPGKFMKTA